MQQPEIRYARAGDINIAYQVLGDGPTDLVIVPGWILNLEVVWEEPSFERTMRRLTPGLRVIIFDKRGTGLSGRAPGRMSLDERMEDIRAVMDAVGSERAAIMGWSEGAAISAVFAASYPEKASALILYGGYARIVRAPDYPFGATPEYVEAAEQFLRENWGQGGGAEFAVPSRAGEEAFRRWFARLERFSISPDDAVGLMRLNWAVDIRYLLPTVGVPTLVLHQRRDHLVPVQAGRFLAEHIPGARFVELPGTDHLFWFSHAEEAVDAIHEFLLGARTAPPPDRLLATVMFADIASSTEQAARLGDERWRDVLESYHSLARRRVTESGGREVKTLGDGFLATFESPTRAIRCATTIRDASRGLGLEVRAGLHTGECEVMADDVGGLAVHIGARVSTAAAPGEVLVSSTVHDLVIGSGIDFADRGTHVLKGVPGEWRLFAVR